MSDSTVIREKATGMNVITLGGEEITLSPFCVYKFQEGCRLLADIIDKCGVQEIMEALVISAGQSSMHQAVAFAPILPKALRTLPEPVCEFVALCCIPNATLSKLYTKDGGIQKEVQKQGQRVLFECETAEIVTALGVFIGMLKLDELGNALSQTAKAFGGLVGTPEMVEEETNG